MRMCRSWKTMAAATPGSCLVQCCVVASPPGVPRGARDVGATVLVTSGQTMMWHRVAEGGVMIRVGEAERAASTGVAEGTRADRGVVVGGQLVPTTGL